MVRAAEVQVPVTRADSVSINSTIFQEILNADPYDVPVLVKHMQDPNALRPNDALLSAPVPSTPGSQVARNLLGMPQRSDMLARRGRLRTVAMSQNRAAPMIGDLFGNGATTLTMAPTIGEVIPFANPPAGGSNFNSFVGISPPNTPVGPFYAGPAQGGMFPLLSTIGVDTDNDGVVDQFRGLQQYQFANGVGNPDVVTDGGPFNAVIDTGRTVVNQDGDTVAVLALQQEVTLTGIPNPGTGGIVGLTKLAENSSPLPRDRMFFNYSHFSNVPLGLNGTNVNRFTPGFEKTFNDGSSSIEFRAPFATTLNSNINSMGVTDGDELEWGNVSLVYKTLLYNDDELAISTGVQTTLPTANPININLADGTTVVRIKNQSVHLMPFVGALYTPNDRLFTQGFLQVDFATNGSDVLTNLDMTKLQLQGIVQDTTFLYFDWSIGYWMYLAEDEGALLTGVAPMFELHYNQSLQSNDVIRGPNGFQLGTQERNVGLLNAIVGTAFQFGTQSALNVGYAFPVGSGDDQQFDGELRIYYNRRFGPQGRQERAM